MDVKDATQKDLAMLMMRWKEGHGPHFILIAPNHASLLLVYGTATTRQMKCIVQFSLLL